MASLKDYPMTLGGYQIPFTNDWSEKSNVIEKTYQTEAGTDMAIVSRFDKLSISAAYVVYDDETAKMFKELSKKREMVLHRYDILAQAYEDRNVRMRNFSIKLVEGSIKSKGRHGVWNVSFNLEEF